MKYARFDSEGRPLAFYDSDIHGNIPPDAEELGDYEWGVLVNGQETMRWRRGQLVQVPRKKALRPPAREMLSREMLLALEVLAERVGMTRDELLAEVESRRAP